MSRDFYRKSDFGDMHYGDPGRVGGPTMPMLGQHVPDIQDGDAME